MTTPRTILVLRFSSIGDIIQTTSVVGTLKKYFPESQIDFITLSKFASLLEGHPHINKVHALDIDAGYTKLRQTGFEMEMMGYDLAIDLHNSTRSQIIRRGFVTTKNVHIKKPRWRRFKLFAFRKNDFAADFTVRTWLHEPIADLLPGDFSIENTQLFVSDVEKNSARELLRKSKMDGKYFVITPGAAWAQKRWSGEKYAKVIDDCVNKYNLHPVLIGGVTDDICDLIKNSADSTVIDVHGKTNLRESLAIVSQAEFVLGSDTGFLHAGEALGIPAITLLGPTSRETGAGVFLEESQVVQNEDIWCRPCSQNGSTPCYRKKQYCMTKIEPEHVSSAVSKVLAI
ncbi:MAG: glycosyltransferase family 9 protein [Candidatus Marinimicrobia bacterium]|jgi:ADP-heptose:LPS heptosyltransferase|nr:glycosyltransferase family 9 protein [Candidatus Neomarinimicrobiota bacterium]MBT3676500.1 glycosyltransferase family 9 protein [Candidatus Neomarinimicrobiota bacterium]MBT3763221.1 glycosyltransferase family 9 protein [Candidatus Neomarinimicrobiota bacterium]MBT4067650.1 glycosyltransferase family 9 protein [Candidatus Neomarinimicrobiota bacterium]MBT4270687.1 glycosyltransferase family 9 protein [Candidatus Neomarinimicrobiota bacterium]